MWLPNFATVHISFVGLKRSKRDDSVVTPLHIDWSIYIIKNITSIIVIILKVLH